MSTCAPKANIAIKRMKSWLKYYR